MFLWKIQRHNGPYLHTRIITGTGNGPHILNNWEKSICPIQIIQIPWGHWLKSEIWLNIIPRRSLSGTAEIAQIILALTLADILVQRQESEKLLKRWMADISLNFRSIAYCGCCIRIARPLKKRGHLEPKYSHASRRSASQKPYSTSAEYLSAGRLFPLGLLVASNRKHSAIITQKPQRKWSSHLPTRI